VYNSHLYDYYKYKDCRGSCVSKSVYCPPKDVCQEPSFVCNDQCLPYYYRQWYQVCTYVRISSIHVKKHNFVCNVSTTIVNRQWYQVCIFERVQNSSYLCPQGLVSNTILQPPVVSGMYCIFETCVDFRGVVFSANVHCLPYYNRQWYPVCTVSLRHV
jgi:hypothetical protein